MELVKEFFTEVYFLFIEIAPYLLFGFFFAGILHVYFPARKLNKYLGQKGASSALNAALLGVPLPLCSCGVIPTGVSLYKNGASKGASVSFLISTPQTGIDSILVTYSLLGLPFAIVRPIVALITGFLGGLFTNTINRNEQTNEHSRQVETNTGKEKNTLKRMFKYAYVDFLQDIEKWLLIGILAAGIIAVAVPDDFFTESINNNFAGMLIMLAVSVPLYVCATASIPIAAVLILKGVSPGAALVFLMAGPATNVATMTVLGKVLGRKTLITYLLSIIGGALIFGMLINEFMPLEWFTGSIGMSMGSHSSHILPFWFKQISAVVLSLLIINGFYRKYKNSSQQSPQPEQIVNYKVFNVSGMNCNHCKANVEKNLSALENISSVQVDLNNSRVTLTGTDIDMNQIKSTIEGIGYEYKGEVKSV